MKKRLFSMLLCLCIVVGTAPAMAQTAQAYYATGNWANGWSMWSQNQSKYKDMRDWGCLVVAQARLLAASGVADSNASAFNPDVYYEWELRNGYINSNMYTTNYAGPQAYASQRGKTLTYEGVVYGHNTAKVWENINAGKYTILRAPVSSSHYVLVNNASSRETGRIRIYQSWSGVTTSIPGTRDLDFTVSEVLTYHVPPAPSVPSYPTAAQNPGSDFYACISYPNGNLNLENRNNNVQTAAVRTADPRQIWRFIRLGDGTYSIMNLYDGRYLDVADAGGAGTNVQVYPGNGSGAQKWKLVQDAYGMSGAYNLLASYDNSIALDVSDAGKNAGTNVQIWTRNGTAAQTFKVTRISNINSVLAHNAGEDFYARISYNGAYLQTTGTEAGRGMDVRVTRTANASDPKQIWHFIRQGNGSYKIVNAYSGWCLDVQGGVAGNQANVWTYYDDHGGVPERWYLMYSPGDATYRIVSALSFPSKIWSLDIPVATDGAAAPDGMNVTLWEQHQNSNQRFTITTVDYAPAPQTLVVRTPPTATAITYGQQLYDSRLSGGVVVNSKGQTVSGSWIWTAADVKPAASGSFEALFSPSTAADVAKYGLTSAKVHVTVNKAALKLTAPTASPIEQGQKLSASKLTGGLALDPDGKPVSGIWSWETPDAVPTGGSYTAVFTPSLSSAYSSGAVRVSITVQQSGCAGGHAWGAWSMSSAPTCTQPGARVRACTKCGARETQAAAALGHSFGLSGGAYVCTICGYTQSSSVTAGLNNFKPVNAYSDSTFWDVASGAWYAGNVASAYRFGLMNGRAAGRFSPGDNVTLAEAVTLAARIHSIYYHGEETFERYDGGNWFDPYVNYARANNICTENYSYNTPATREEFAHILARALPKEALAQLPGNNISFADGGSIVYAGDVDRLCGAGIINGVDVGGLSYFMPSRTVKRSEAAAIITRMVQPDLRLS